MTAPSPLAIAAAVVTDPDGRLLLVRKQGTRYFMQPGGKLEAGEDALTALRRELIEEVGLDVAGDRFMPLGTYSAAAANEPGMQVTAQLFAVVVDEPVEAAAEIVEAVWVTRKEAAQLRLAPLTLEYVLPTH